MEEVIVAYRTVGKVMAHRRPELGDFRFSIADFRFGKEDA
jgi:hypothetical protein